MEGKVFVCTWRRVGDRYRVWVRNRPALVAEGDTFAGADEDLSGVICEATGDGESVHEYDPPRPVEEVPGLLFRLALVSGESRARIANYEALYSEGPCPQCTRPRGERTETPLELERIESGACAGPS